MEYSPNEKDILVSNEYKLMVYSPNGKDITVMVKNKVVNVIVKVKKCSITDIQCQSKLNLCII